MPRREGSHPTHAGHTWTSSWHRSAATRSRSSPQHEHCIASAAVEPGAELGSTPPRAGRGVPGHALDMPPPFGERSDASEAHTDLWVVVEPEQAALHRSVTAAPAARLPRERSLNSGVHHCMSLAPATLATRRLFPATLGGGGYVPPTCPPGGPGAEPPRTLGSLTVPVMRIEVLHVPDCPNLERARARLREAVDAAAVEASVEELEIATATSAATLGMHGSPTILVDGVDAFPTSHRQPSMSCRLFDTPNGLDGAPTVAQLVEALSR